MNLRRYITLVVVMWLGTGCISLHQSAAVDVEPLGWHRPAVLRVPNTDTTALRNLTLFLRCNARFTEDTLTVHLEINTPDGLRLIEPIRLTTPRANRAAALLHEITLPYRHRVCFNRLGDYRLTITPTRSVTGVEAVGINIDPIN